LTGAAVRAQVAQVDVTRDKLRRAFSDIVVEDKLLDALGPALISRNAIFLYGASGMGETTIAERLMRVFEDAVVVPWAVEVDGQIVMLADPAVHQPIPIEDLDGGLGPRRDPGMTRPRKWCRPCPQTQNLG